MLVGNMPIKDSIFQGAFECTYFPAWRKIVYAHDFFTVDRRLEITNTVFFLYVMKFLTYKAEIIQKITFPYFVLACDVSFA